MTSLTCGCTVKVYVLDVGVAAFAELLLVLDKMLPVVAVAPLLAFDDRDPQIYPDSRHCVRGRQVEDPRQGWPRVRGWRDDSEASCGTSSSRSRDGLLRADQGTVPMSVVNKPNSSRMRRTMSATFL